MLLCQYPPADPYYLNQPNYSWPSELSCGFSNLWPWIFRIPLPTHKIHNREGWKKEQTNKQTNRHRLGLAPSAREGTPRHILCILWANASVYFERKLSQSHKQCWYLLALVNPASVCQQVLAVVFLISILLSSLPCFHLLAASFYRLVPVASFCWLSPSLDSSFMPRDLWDLPFFVLPVS